MQSAENELFVFDGDCGFCGASVRWLQRSFGLGDVARPSQGFDLEGLGLTLNDVQRQAWFIDRSGSYGGAAAFARWLQTGGRFPTWLGHALDLPGIRWLASVAYRRIAASRARISGSWATTCGMDAEMAHEPPVAR